MGPKPFWGDALKSDSRVTQKLQGGDTPEQGRTVQGRAAAFILLLALALAFGFVPALEDRTPQRGSFPLPPASTADAPQGREVERKGRTTSAAPPAPEASPLVDVPEVSEVLDEVVALVPPPDLGGAIALPAPVG